MLNRRLAKLAFSNTFTYSFSALTLGVVADVSTAGELLGAPCEVDGFPGQLSTSGPQLVMVACTTLETVAVAGGAELSGALETGWDTWT